MADTLAETTHWGSLKTDVVGYVGIDTLQEQIRKKVLRKGFEFNIIVVGRSGLGKSTLINTLFKANISRRSSAQKKSQDAPSPYIIPKTTEVKSISHVIEEKGTRLRLTVTDTPGFGDQINNENCWLPILEYINEQYEKYLSEEQSVTRKKHIPDTRLHCCLYFIPPTGHSLTSLDIEFMRRLHKCVNVVPVIAKADTLTVEERTSFKERIKEDLELNGINVYPMQEFEDDPEESVVNDKLRDAIPFAVVGSDKQHKVNGHMVFGRQTQWGLVEVENRLHCEFPDLRDMLIRCSTLPSSPFSGTRIFRSKRASSQECGGNITATGKRNQLTSPNYPDGYKSKQFCRWTINGDGNITLVFKVFEVEESPSCEYDNVDVLAGLPPRSLGKLCGSSRNKTILTNSSAVTVIFKSDDSYEEKGFLMEYFTDNPQGRVADQSCHDTLTANAGNVTSPNYPLQYPDNSTCWILINVRPGSVIVMRFKEIALEFDETCSFDFVEIFDGPSEESPLLGKYCGNSQRRVLRSMGNNVLIHFRSDDLLNNRGFHLEYEADDGGIHASSEGSCVLRRDAKNGTITSPNYPNRYSPSSNCVVDLEAPIDARVALHFQDFSLEPDKNCSFDYVQLWDGHVNGSWTSMGRLCGDKDDMKEIISTRNKMRLKFYTDNFSEFRGFVANYKLVPITNIATPQSLEDRPPDVVSTSELIDEMPRDASVPYEESHIMKCTPKIPGATIIWKKGDVVLNGTSPLPNLHVVSPTTIWIRKMDALLEGRYSCTVLDDDRVATGSVLLTMITRREKPKCNI